MPAFCDACGRALYDINSGRVCNPCPSDETDISEDLGPSSTSPRSTSPGSTSARFRESAVHKSEVHESDVHESEVHEPKVHESEALVDRLSERNTV